jgi:hypothetical protein
MNLSSHVTENPLTVTRNPLGRCSDGQKQELRQKRLERPYFPVVGNPINIIFWSLSPESCPGKKQTLSARLTTTHHLGTPGIQCRRMGDNSGVFRPKGNDESFSSRFFSASLTV